MTIDDHLEERKMERLGRGLVRGLVEGCGLGIFAAAESLRGYLVHPRSIIFPPGVIYFKHAVPALSQAAHPKLFEVLSHGGDLWEGYFHTLIVYNVANVVAQRLPEKYKLGFALAVSNFSIIGTETGLLQTLIQHAPVWLRRAPYFGSADSWDIPIGVAASLVYLGVNLTGKYLVERWFPKGKSGDAGIRTQIEG